MKMCGRCSDDVETVYPANCHHHPEAYRSIPLGMYHCPDCGAMVLAGWDHPDLCQPCLLRQHPRFDSRREEQ